MPSLHVLLKKEDIQPAQVAGRVVIVLDILFATSTIVFAFSRGATAVWPALDADDANAVAAGIGECLRAGEYLAQRLPGFAPAFPLQLSPERLSGRTLVYCTTNGTVAVKNAAAAEAVYVGALLNGAAVVEHVLRTHPGASIVVACSGSVGNFNMEDFYGAGHYVDHFLNRADFELNDAARAARLFRLGYESRTALLNSRIGLMMQARGLTEEVHYSAQLDVLDVVARLDGAVLRPVEVQRSN